MSTSPDRPTWLVRFALPGGFVFALVGLIAEAVSLEAETVLDGMLVSPLALAFGLGAVLWLLTRALRDPLRAPRLRREALLVPCVLAPLAALSPWVAAPSHLGVALGGLPFFVSWLDRYPTMLGVNHEVLLGIGAVLGACAMPAALAFYVGTRRAPRPRVVVTLVVLHLVAYVPVLLRLDADTLGYAALVTRDGPLSFFGPSDTPLWTNVAAAFWIGAGALLRALATLSMLVFVPWSLRAAKAPPVVWETA
ncbi:MAG: hypothetical protein KC619_25110 [Myxococcales bacterium]|nr:hypothetical protein [Myxococcales bacterium]